MKSNFYFSLLLIPYLVILKSICEMYWIYVIDFEKKTNFDFEKC